MDEYKNRLAKLRGDEYPNSMQRLRADPAYQENYRKRRRRLARRHLFGAIGKLLAKPFKLFWQWADRFRGNIEDFWKFFKKEITTKIEELEEHNDKQK